MPAALSEAFARWAGREGEPDLLGINGAWAEQDAALSTRLLARAPDREMGALLTPLFRCTYHPRSWTSPTSEATWEAVFAEDAPSEIEASVEVADAWFRGDLRAAHFAPEASLHVYHLPAVRLICRFDLPFRVERLEGWTAEDGTFDLGGLRAWDEEEGDLVSWMQWDLDPELRAALPEVCFGLDGFRTRFEAAAQQLAGSD